MIVSNNNKPVAIWLLIGVAMLVIQVLLGGITRLTGSGLSITEWKPILGIIPPLNYNEWMQSFELYQQKTSQYKYLNQDFTLTNFKFIYFWEWMHRAWARLMGVVFLIPFFYFLFKRYFSKKTLFNLALLFVFGAAQGLIGWLMVKSGLNNDMLYVSHIKLAIHFIAALILIAFTYWFALCLLIDKKLFLYQPKIMSISIFIIFLLFIQLIYGAFMSGLHAASVAPTWPTINGDFFPITLKNESFIFHKINIHFIHRLLAFFIILSIIYFSYKAYQIKDSAFFNKIKYLPLLFTVLQILLGIYTVLSSTKLARNHFGNFEYLAQAHQLTAMFLMMSLLNILFLVRKK